MLFFVLYIERTENLVSQEEGGENEKYCKTSS